MTTAPAPHTTGVRDRRPATAPGPRTTIEGTR